LQKCLRRRKEQFEQAKHSTKKEKSMVWKENMEYKAVWEGRAVGRRRALM